jgi:rubrerythrin
MSHLGRRLERLERALTGGPCPVCAGLATITMVAEEDRDKPPRRCPGCGAEALRFTITIVPDRDEEERAPWAR